MPALCLVPTPLRAARAARRLCDAQGGVLFGARVTTPEALAASILASAGDGRPVLGPMAERLLAWEAAGAAGGALAGLAPSGGLARALASALRELRRAELSSGQVAAAAGDVPAAAAARLGGLAAALRAYEERLGALGALDGPGAVRAAATALAAGAAADDLRDLDALVLDGFVAPPEAARDLAVELAHRARRTHLRVPSFPERPELCTPAEPLLRRFEGLHELAARREVDLALERLDGDGGRAPRLARALLAAADGPGGGPPGDAGLLLAAAGAGEEGEAEVAAELLARLVEAGFAPDELVALSPSPSSAAPRLARALAARGLALVPARGAPLAELPPIRAVRAALEAAVSPGRAALEAVAASPYLGLARWPAGLARWLDRAGARDGRGDPAEALRRRAEALTAPAAAAERAGLTRAADALAAARAALAPLAAPGTAREHAARLRGVLLRAGARRRAARGDLDLARRDLGALARLEELADELARALALLGRSGERWPAGRWAELLDLALDGAAASAEGPVAGAVELWPLSEAPGLSARGAVVLGCERGAFPAQVGAEPLLRDADRAALARAAGRAAVATGPQRRAAALHAAFCALAAGREALGVTWRGPGPDGPGAAPAPLALELLLAGGVTLPGAPAGDGAGGPDAQALRAVARAGREGEPSAALAAAPAGLAARAASALARGALERERRDAVLARRSSPAAGALPPELWPELRRALPRAWSPSQLERQARCPFQLFAGAVLGLAEPDPAELDAAPRDEGLLLHAILERFLAERLARAALPLRGTPDEREALAAAAAELFARWEAGGHTGDPSVWPGRRAALLARLERVVAAEALAGDGAVPALFEHRFGGADGAPPLALEDPAAPGAPVLLQGRLDRVDASPDRLVLVDYKSGKDAKALGELLRPEALGVVSFQAPAYLLAAARALPGRARLEATYLLLGTGERLEACALDAGDPLLALDPARRAAARAAGVVPFADAVIAAVRRAEAGDFPIASRGCDRCAHGAVCRFEGAAEAPR